MFQKEKKGLLYQNFKARVIYITWKRNRKLRTLRSKLKRNLNSLNSFVYIIDLLYILLELQIINFTSGDSLITQHSNSVANIYQKSVRVRKNRRTDDYTWIVARNPGEDNELSFETIYHPRTF